jgi:hypothetical protein
MLKLQQDVKGPLIHEKSSKKPNKGTHLNLSFGLSLQQTGKRR